MARKPKEITSYTHRTESGITVECDIAPGPYYVSVQDAGKFGLILGPFQSHKEAIDMVEPCRSKVVSMQPWAHFYAFGTARVKTDYKKPGVMNEFFPECFK